MSADGAARRPTCSLIPEILELQRHRKVVPANSRDGGLQIVFALAGDADLVVLDLRGDLELGVADERGDLLGNSCFDALFDLDDLAGMAERRNVRLALLHVFEADLPLGELADDHLDKRFNAELILCGE